MIFSEIGIKVIYNIGWWIEKTIIREFKNRAYVIPWWKKNLIRIFIATNHKDIASLYFYFRTWCRMTGTTLSLVIRWELRSAKNNHRYNGEYYNVVVTSHALIIIFFFLMPVLIRGFGNILIPLMIGLPEIAFPRINNLSFWLLPSAYFILILSILTGGSGTRWTIYPPLSSRPFHSTCCVDYSIFALHTARASSIMRAINFLTTISCFALPRSEFYTFPLFIWSICVTTSLLALSVPVLAARLTILLFDRNLRTSFFNPDRGGDAVMFQHLFWFFRHPEVYVLILPRFRIISQVVQQLTHSKKVFRYYRICWSIRAIRIMRCIVWGHHIFTVRLDMDTRVYFTTVTIIIAVPTRVKLFSWLSIMIRRSYRLERVRIWALRFIFLFTLRRITGVILANNSIDLLLHDTYFVVAHFHYVLSISAVYTALTRTYYYYPFVFRRCPNQRISELHFWVMFRRVNTAFFPIHWSRLAGIPRRYYCYSDELHAYHRTSTIGAFVSSARWPIFFVHIIETIMSHKRIKNKCWYAEWSHRTPPRRHSNIQTPRVVL